MSEILTHAQDRLVNLALRGDSDGAIALLRGVAGDGARLEEVVDIVLAGALREIGVRWHSNRCTVVDEHVATGVVRTVLEAAIAMPHQRSIHFGSVAIASAEGDWHGLAARLQAELLNAAGWYVHYLGASAPADQVQRYLARKAPVALIITCSYPLAFSGAARLAECAHAVGVPVLIGGGAVTPLRLAPRLGADGDPVSLGGIVQLLDRWVDQPPSTFHAPRLRLDAEISNAEIEHIATVATAVLACRLSTGSYDERWRARSLEDLTQVVRFAHVAQLVDVPEVFTEFLTWRSEHLSSRGVPNQEVHMGIAVLRDVIGDDLAFGERAEVMDGLASVMQFRSRRARH